MPQAARRGAGARSHVKRAPSWLAAAALAVAVIGAPAAASAQTARTAACDLYRALDRRCGCSADDYLRGYGEKYCERFMRATGWSPAGLRWRNQTLVCLTNELRQFLARRQGCDCAAVKTFAFDSHARCYTRQPSSVCRLPLSDIARIYALVDAADLIAPLGSRQALAITLACVWQNGHAGARPEGPLR
jgi:hypothetical protein